MTLVALVTVDIGDIDRSSFVALMTLVLVIDVCGFIVRD